MRLLTQVELLLFSLLLLFAGISTYLGNELLDHVFKVGAAFGQPTNIAISLHTGDPGLTGANEHGATAAYARVVMNVWDVAASRATQNTNAITFAQATANYSAQITHFGLWDAASAGNFLGGAALTTARTILSGDTPQFAAGALDVTMA